MRILSSNDDVSFHIGHTCEEYILRYALVCSGLLVLFACIVAIVTFQSKNKLLKFAGIKSEGEVYHTLKRLLLEEKYRKAKLLTESKTEQDSNSQSLPPITVLPRIKTTSQVTHPDEINNNENSPVGTPINRRENRIRPHREGSFLSFTSIPQQEYHICTLRVLLNIHREKKETAEHQWLHYYHHMRMTIYHIFLNHRYDNHKKSKMTPMMERVESLRMHAQTQRKSATSPQPLTLIIEDENNSNYNHNSHHDDIELQIEVNGDNDNEMNSSNSGSESEENLNIQSHPLAQELTSIFPFSNRSFYEFLIQQMLLLDSLFLAIWATNLITISAHSNSPVLFNLLFIIPITLMTSLDFVILFFSSVLFAVTSLNNKGSEWICEQDEICHRVLPQLRKEILDILPDGSHSKKVEELFQLISTHQPKITSMRFRNLDNDNNNSNSSSSQVELSSGINCEGFAQFLHSLNIHPSEKEIRALFRSMDRDDRLFFLLSYLQLYYFTNFYMFSGSIELSELKALLTDPNMQIRAPKKKSFIDI